MKRVILVTLSLATLTFIPTVSAHGGGTTDASTVLIIALLCSVSGYLLVQKFAHFHNGKVPPLLFSMIIYTSTVHIILGIERPLLLVGGVGILAVTIYSMLGQENSIRKNSKKLISLIAISMFIGYFAENHDIHYMAKDYLGITTKISEIVILAIMVRKPREVSMEQE